jgi:predicted Rossmann-fold nucleotide-binding protein
MKKNKLISPKDLDLFVITDDTDAVVESVLEYMREVGPPEETPRALG